MLKIALLSIAALVFPQTARADEPPASSPIAGEEIVVTATRSPRPVRDVSAAVTVLPRAEIERSAAKTLDELLVAVPSFALFRRSSSMAADPSSQGMTLRGVGPSAISRSLVLVDGVPANDPFGGWVYWRAVPRLGIQRLEIVPGGGSALYGNSALAGVVQVVSRRIEDNSVEGGVEYGSFGTTQLSLRAAHRFGAIAAVVEGEGLKSGGYGVVATPGAIDGTTPSEHGVINGRIEASLAPDLSLTLRAGYFAEDENGGTRWTTAAVRRLEYAAGIRYAPDPGSLEVSVFGHDGSFTQDRARVTSDRAAEFQSAHQEVPAQDLGTGVSWTNAPLLLAGAHTLSVGGDARRITADTREDLFPSPATAQSVQFRDARGEQRLYGAFAQDIYDLSQSLQLSLALRYDRWDNRNASRLERLAGGTATVTPFGARRDSQVSPRAGTRFRPVEWLTLRAAAFQSFRAPTLNELYRPFQVGTVRTDSNQDLGPETLQGAEAGFDVTSRFGLAARVTGFRNALINPITSVTIGTNLRQRQNLGEARIQGIEAEVGWRFLRNWLASGAYTWARNRVTDAPGQPQLVGKQLPQDPEHRATFSLSFDDARSFSAQAQLRYVGAQFEDDVNKLPMSSVFLFDLFASWHATRFMDLFVAAENVFDKSYLVGRSGVDTVGQPRSVHGGFRLRTN
ncbi:MAG TPA: TonB-dependent receptor [Myxococcales bacterium]